MSDERDRKEDPAEQFKQGIGLLFRAALGAATSVKKELDRSDLGRSLEDAGREFARAATNVVERISSEIGKKPEQPWERPGEHAEGHGKPERREDETDEFDGVKAPKRKGSPEEPGFRIMTDDHNDKPR
jgi:hypothetical protein